MINEEKLVPLIEVEEVKNVFFDCLFKVHEDNSNAILCNGITFNVGFNPIKIADNKEKIISMIENLPENFKKEIGGGWSFLQACIDKNDVLWTGDHRRMEELMLLGIAIGKIDFLLPRELWGALPGGVPYFVIL